MEKIDSILAQFGLKQELLTEISLQTELSVHLAYPSEYIIIIDPFSMINIDVLLVLICQCPLSLMLLLLLI